MNILHFGKFYPPFNGGMEIYLRDLAEQQSQKHTVTALVHNHNFKSIKSSSQEQTINQVHVIRQQTLKPILFTPIMLGANKAVSKLRNSNIEVLSTGYLLIEGGNVSSVERVSKTQPMSQNNIQAIVDTAKAGELLGNHLIYLEAGSGAKTPVQQRIISAVKNEINIPLIVGGGIKTEKQKQEAYLAGADMVVMGTVFEEK